MKNIAPQPSSTTTEQPRQIARAVGLRYVSDNAPGIKRIRNGNGFRYIGPDGKTIRDTDALTRITSLAIPPAWEQVWICPLPNGHIQATARDAKGRKQYRYHPRWRNVRDEAKYERMLAFGNALPVIRKRVQADLSKPGMPREKVIAAVVRLLETTLIRVGNKEYARNNRSFGLTTMLDKHVEINAGRLRFRFRGKSGKYHNVALDDARLARIVRRCRDLPGQELFQYIDENNNIRAINSSDVNDYLHAITNEDYTAKDFRTWAGTMLAALAFQEIAAFDSATQGKKNVVQVIESVAEKLGNTPSICRKCYVHPGLIDAYLDGSMHHLLKQQTEAAMRDDAHALNRDEMAILSLLRKRLRQVGR